MLDVRDLLATLPSPEARALDLLALWLVTYAVHSTLLLGSAWLSGRLFPAAAERVWRIALFASLVTATLHAGGRLPGVTVIRLAGLPVVGAATAPPSRTAPIAASESALAEPSPSARSERTRTSEVADADSWRATSPQPDGATELPMARAHRPPQASASSGARPPVGARHPSIAPFDRAGASGPPSQQHATGALIWRGVGLAWTAVLAATLLLLATRTVRFVWQHVGRETIRAGEAVRVLRELTRRAGFRPAVRLSVSPVARVPMAKGWVRPEICLPPGLDRRLATEELEAALAHELAHLERRDPVWRALGRTVASALAFQPLNRVACRVLEDEAELRCDDRAAALTGRPAALARCLTRVADWTTGSASAALPALAANGSTLRRRVLRLLDDRPRRPAPWWTQLVALVPVAAVMALVPTIAALPPVAAAAPPATLEPAHPAAASSSRLAVAGRSSAGREAGPEVATRPPSASGEASGARDAMPVVHVLSLPVFSEVRPEPPTAPVAPAPPVPATSPPAEPPPAPPMARAPHLPATPTDVAAPPPPSAPPGLVAPHVHVAPPAPVPALAPRQPAPVLAPPAPPAAEREESEADADAASAADAEASAEAEAQAEERGQPGEGADEWGDSAEEQERIAEEQERVAEEQERIADEQERVAEEQERVAEEQERVAEEQERVAEERERLAEQQERAAEEQERVAEEAEQRIEAAMEAAEGEIAEAIEIEMEAIEEAIEVQVESIEEEVELALEPLEAAIDALSDQLEEALDSDDRQRTEGIAAEIGVLGAAMGELGGRIGEIVGETGLSDIDDEVHATLAQHAEKLAELVQPQIELAERLGREIEDRRRRGAPLEDEETRAMHAELDRLTAQTEARRGELERDVETLGRGLRPVQERLRSLEAELRTEIEQWRRRHAALLERIENGEPALDARPAQDGSLR